MLNCIIVRSYCCTKKCIQSLNYEFEDTNLRLRSGQTFPFKCSFQSIWFIGSDLATEYVCCVWYEKPEQISQFINQSIILCLWVVSPSAYSMRPKLLYSNQYHINSITAFPFKKIVPLPNIYLVWIFLFPLFKKLVLLDIICLSV